MGCFVVGGGYRLLGLLTKRRTLWYCQHVWSSCTIYLFNDDVGAVTFILLLIILILTCPHPPAAIYYIKHILAHKEKLNTVYSVELLGSMDQWFWDSGFVLCLYLRSQSYADSCKGSFSMDALPSSIEACVFSVCVHSDTSVLLLAPGCCFVAASSVYGLCCHLISAPLLSLMLEE